MHPFTRSFCALLLVLVCLPVLAANSNCPTIRALQADDVQTGEPVTITWSYSGNGTPQSQLLTGHDFAEPIQLAPGQTSYTYTPTMPGEKHAMLTNVTSCGTFSVTTKYQVKQCSVVPPAMTVSATSVAPGDAIQASVALQPGHTARWEVTNGTASATTGSAISVTAGGAGSVTITAFVSRGSSCSVAVTSTVQVVQACPIAQPQMYHPPQATAGGSFYLYFEPLPAPLTSEIRVTGAHVFYQAPTDVYMGVPESGTIVIDVIVSNGTCSRTFTKSFTVQNCTSSAVVTAGETGSCGATSAVATFTGLPPFQGSWSDGEYFFTYDSTLTRPIAGGTYTLSWFMDATCEGPISGSVTGGASLPMPQYTVDPIINGGYYGNDTCPGLERIARLDSEVPAGATIEWGIANGTILSGQGTSEVHFAGDAPGNTNLTVLLRDANGCPSASYSYPYLLTFGKPEFTVTVDPPVIPAGGTAIITVNHLYPEWVRGMGVNSSLGDPILYLGNSQWEYRSGSGPGTASIRVEVQNACHTTVQNVPLTIEQGGPITAQATVRSLGSTCENYYVWADFSGTPPFTGTWSTGETFTAQYPSTGFRPPASGTYTLVAFSDANGPGTISGSATFDFTVIPPPEFTVDAEKVCVGTIVTATMTTPVPPGVTPQWYVGYGDIISGQGTPSIQIRPRGPFGADINLFLISETACSMTTSYKYVDTYRPPQQPLFYAYPVFEGGSTTFDVTLDPGTVTWGFENTLGDLIEIVGNPQPNVYTLRYTSSHGVGNSTIRIYGTNACGTAFEASSVMQILPPAPTATITATVSETCGNDVTVTFTGTPPFTATWAMDGTTFTTTESTYTRHFPNTQSWAYLYNVSDANSGGYASNFIELQYTQLPYQPVTGPAYICVGSTGTVTTELPAGWTVQWDAGTNARIVSGQGTGTVEVEVLSEGFLSVNGYFTTAEGCTTFGGSSIWIPPADAANPVITMPVTSIRAGESFEFVAAFDGTAYQSLNWESSNGDPIWNAGQNGMTFTLAYQSQNGPGPTTIKVYGTTICGKYVESTVTLDIAE
jgi:hypothetical protein